MAWIWQNHVFCDRLVAEQVARELEAFPSNVILVFLQIPLNENKKGLPTLQVPASQRCGFGVN